MSFPSYIKHLSDTPVVGFDGLSLSPMNLTQYSFVPGILDNLAAPIIVDTGDGKKRIVPPGPITLYEPMNPYAPTVTVSPTLQNITPTVVGPIVTQRVNNSKFNVTISGPADDVNKIVRMLESI